METRDQQAFDRLYRNFLGRGQLDSETLEQWRSAGRVIMRDQCMAARARATIAYAQHAAKQSETEVARIIASAQVSSRFRNRLVET